MSKYLRMYFKGPKFFVTNNINFKIDKIDPLIIFIKAQQTEMCGDTCNFGTWNKVHGESYVYWTVHHCHSWRIKDQLDVTCYFDFLCAQHVSDINISIIRSLRLYCWITTSVVLFSVRCVLEIWCGWVWVVSVLQAQTHLLSYVYRKVHHCNSWRVKDQLDVTCYFFSLLMY